MRGRLNGILLVIDREEALVNMRKMKKTMMNSLKK
jgi:hypothetical protein